MSSSSVYTSSCSDVCSSSDSDATITTETFVSTSYETHCSSSNYQSVAKNCEISKRTSSSKTTRLKSRAENFQCLPLFRIPASEAGIMWCGGFKKLPIIIFSALSITDGQEEVESIGKMFNMTFKLARTECKLLRRILSSHGFHESFSQFEELNILWTGCHLKPYLLRFLTDFQKVNHFPRSYEITRKDRLAKNIKRMQRIKDLKSFDFVPSTFILPEELDDFYRSYLGEKGAFIVKPIASSRGRGIYLVKHPEEVSCEEPVIVSRYISNPLLLDGFKFDVRLYVAVTSYQPFICYIYEEGLVRFATVRYQHGVKHLKTQCMHLTNYSVNKRNFEYVQNDDADIEDFGNKWSLGALLRYLHSEGVDVTGLMVRIEEVIIKSFLCVLPPINVACRMFPASKARCFELYGFDIIIDENFRPWLLEVNLSPSLVCDSPLDFKVKSHMLTDLFNLVGITCHDPSRKSRGMCNGSNVTSNGTSFVPPDPSAYFVSASDQCFRNASTKTPSQRQNGTNSQSDRGVNNLYGIPISGMMPKEINKTQMNILRRLSEESARAGGWIRLYPNPVAWEQYAHLFPYESNKHNNECNRIHYNEILYTSVDQYNQSSDKSLNDIGNSILMDAYNAAYASYILQSVSWSTSVLINQLKTTDKLTTGENTTDNLKDLIGSLKVPEECTYFHPNYAPGITNLHCLFSRGITHRHSFSNDIKVIQKPTIITSAIHQKPLPLHNVTPSQLHNYITNFIHTPTNDEYGSSLRDCRRVTLLYCYVMNHMPYFLRKLGRKPKILPGVCLTPGCLHNHASKNNICGIWQICKSVNSTYESPLDSNTPHTASNCQDNNVSIPEHISNSANTNENKKDLHSESLLKPTRIKSQQRNTSRKHKHSLVVNNASKLSPIQARHAFTAYLSRIQNRLVIEADQCSAATNQYQNDDEEIKLLIKFLHTASANLSSSQNPLKTDNLYSQVQSSGGRNQRESKLELARLLNEFINVYQYETVNNKQLVRSGKVTNCMKILNSTQFWRLIRDSNESDLESLLAEYTRLNKSVDVFLGRQDDKSKKRPLPNLNNQKLRPFKTGSSSSDSGFQSINEVNSSPPAKNDSNPIGKQRFLEHLSNSKMHNHCSVDSSPSSSFFSSPTSSSMSLPNESSSEEKAIHSSNKDVVNSNKNYKQKLSTMNINYSDKPEYCQKCTFINPVKSAINLLSCGKCISSVTKTSQQNDISPTEGDKRNENKVDPKDDSPLHAEFCMSKKDRSCQTIKSSGSQTARRPQSSNKSVSKLRKPIKKVNRRKVQPLVYSTRNNTSSSLSLSSFGKQNNRINTQDQRRFKSNCALRSNKLANSPSNNRVHEKNNYKPRNSNTVKKLALVPGINPPICKPVYMLSADKSLSFIHLHGHNNSCENDSDKSDSKTDGEYVLSDVCLNKNCRTDKSKFNRTSRRIYPLSSARKTH